MLRVVNAHLRDAEIFFNEEAHKYTTAKVKDMTSVTTLIKKFFSEFDADGILSKMERFGALAKKYPGMSRDEVKQSWKDKGSLAAKTGTRLHKFIEMYFNGIEDLEDSDAIAVEIGMFKNWFLDLDEHYSPYRTEWIIFDEELKIAGTIDMLFRVDAHDARKVAIFDWKCSKEIKFKNKYGKGLLPIGHVEDCNYNHYSLQLSLYKYLLEKNYGLVVEEMNLVVIHRTNSEALVIPVKDMSNEIANMLDTIATQKIPK